MKSKSETARRLVRALLADKQAPTPTEIAEAVAQAVKFSSGVDDLEGPLDEDVLRNEFEATYSVFFPTRSRIIEDRTGHVPWLQERRASVEWNFWGRYEFFLTEVKKIPTQVVARLNSTTDDVLARMEDPIRQGTWDRRGLVVGNVQSGKTSHYSGLICKALDAGYKLVIVLAGIHNSLRSQTQMRIDQGIIGFDTSQNPVFRDDNLWIGVGTLRGWPRLPVNSLTTSRNDGDFGKAISSRTTTTLGRDPYILVVKKQKSILENIISWASHTNKDLRDDGKEIIRDVPLLVIDDEADNASINTARVPEGEDPSEYEPSAINAKIRQLLAAFEKKVYVGYTATPFANIFAPTDVNHEKLQDDIFPRSFICSLSEPSNYVGPARVFGIDGDPDSGIEPQDGLPIVVPVTDHRHFFPDRYKKDHDPGGLPPSLREAIRVFVLACAGRRARGQKRVYNSMLIHLARFVDVQKRVYDYVQEEFAALQRQIRYDRPGTKDGIWQELELLWNTLIVPSSRSLMDVGYSPVEWSDVVQEVREAVERTKLSLINGEAADILDYLEHPEGINVIAIGGDKLSRGLTLEGLSVSYYLRSSRMYDTLMQMGRWFGYRDGYLDFCRLYTTPELRDWYRHIAMADIELRREFQAMADCGMTPEQYGFKVRTHTDGLLITALNKSRHTKTMKVSFAGRLIQSKILLAEDLEPNQTLLSGFLGKLSGRQPRGPAQNVFWTGASADDVCDFLTRLKSPANDLDADGERLAKFIQRQVASGGLKNWSVLLAGGRVNDEGLPNLFLEQLRPVLRGPESRGTNPATITLKNANILNPPDQHADFHGVIFTQEHLEELRARDVFIHGGKGDDLRVLEDNVGKDLIEVATQVSIKRHEREEIRGSNKPTAPNGKVVRDMRRRGDGLLIVYPTVPKDNLRSGPMIGVAISFPTDDQATPLEYRVNQVYEQLHLSDPDEQNVDG